MPSKKIVAVVGARPQFIKAAAVSRIIRRRHKEILVHTGQHYDREMSGNFFKELDIPRPDYCLGCGPGRPEQQLSKMVEGIGRVITKEAPDCVLVYGDTNSTLAGALAAAGKNVRLVHIEAGLRSYRLDMPEEVNRIIADRLSSVLFCPTENAVNNLRKEGIKKGVFNVGDVMYDAVLFNLRKAVKVSGAMARLGLNKGEYFLATVHRAENADSATRLGRIMRILGRLPYKTLLPVHPRTAKTLRTIGMRSGISGIRMIKPVSYFDMLMLQANARAVLTDSGGVQKEAFFLQTPCITLRDETEWPETTAGGWNTIAGIDEDRVSQAISRIGRLKASGSARPFGTGCSGEKISQILEREL